MLALQIPPTNLPRRRPKLSLSISPDAIPTRYTCTRRSMSALTPATAPAALLSPTARNTHLNSKRGGDSDASSCSSGSEDEEEDAAPYTAAPVVPAYAAVFSATRPKKKKKAGRVQFSEEVAVIPAEEGEYVVDERWTRSLF